MTPTQALDALARARDLAYRAAKADAEAHTKLGTATGRRLFERADRLTTKADALFDQLEAWIKEQK